MRKRILVKCKICLNDFQRYARPGEDGEIVKRERSKLRQIHCNTCSPKCSKEHTKRHMAMKWKIRSKKNEQIK